jgi:hypothetical protein
MILPALRSNAESESTRTIRYSVLLSTRDVHPAYMEVAISASGMGAVVTTRYGVCIYLLAF